MKRYLSAVALLAAGALLCPFAAACGGGENGDGEENVKAIYLDSVSGDDENSGRSPQRAYKTLAPLARGEEVEPGTTIYLNGEFKGTLSFKGSGTEEEPIVVTSLDGENPALIDGDGGGCTVLLDGQSHVTLDNLEITMTADNLMARNGIFVVGESGIISGITIKDCYIRNIHGTHLGQVEAGDYWDSFYASGAISFRYLKDKTDEQNKFDRITVTGCRIENILGCGIRFHDMGAGIIDEWANAYFSNVLIEDTLIDTTSADGILFQNCYKPVVRRCKVFRVGALEPEGSQNYHAAVWACATESPLYEYNEVAYTKYVGGDGQAFDMDWGCKGVSVWQYNYTHDNEGGVMLRHEDFKGIYRYNISVNDGSKAVGRGLIFHSAPNGVRKEPMYFYNNIFYCDETVDLQISYAFLSYPDWGLFSTRLDQFKNNIFVFANDDVSWGADTVYTNNCYYRLGGEYSVPSQDAFALKAAPGFAKALDKIPQSAEEAAEYFALSPSSPCLGKGAPLTEEESLLFENKNFIGESANDNVGPF